jgi:hypothetical protein
MRKDLINSLLVGGAIGFIAIGLHVVTAAASPAYRLLALAVAGLVLFAVHLAIALRRGRQARHDADDGEHEAGARHNPRNPFFRELTSDWTGLDEHPAGEQPPNGAEATAADTRAPQARPGEDKL